VEVNLKRKDDALRHIVLSGHTQYQQPEITSCRHAGEVVPVGPYEVMAGGTMYLQSQDLQRADVLVPLTDEWARLLRNGHRYDVLPAILPDFGGVPKNWRNFLCGKVLPLLEEGKKVLAFCTAGHGRTGTFLASLIAILESREQTPDPIKAVWERYCEEAVETLAQAEGIFAIRGEELPDEHYQRTLRYGQVLIPRNDES